MSKTRENIKFELEKFDKEIIKTCPICNNNNFTKIADKDRYGFDVESVLCENCSIVFITPRLTANSYSKFYAKIYRPLVSDYYGRVIDADSIQVEQLIYSKEVISLIEPFINKQNHNSFLDVGGSTGVISREFKKVYDFDCTVIDPSPDEINFAKKSDIKTITGLVETWDPGEQKFDIIGMFQTIDHLLDPLLTFNKIRSIISDDGIFIVDMVDYLHVASLKTSIIDALKIDHPFSFNFDVFKYLLNMTKFEILTINRIGDGHLICAVCKPINEKIEFDYDRTSILNKIKEGVSK